MTRTFEWRYIDDDDDQEFSIPLTSDEFSVLDTDFDQEAYTENDDEVINDYLDENEDEIQELIDHVKMMLNDNDHDEGLVVLLFDRTEEDLDRFFDRLTDYIAEAIEDSDDQEPRTAMNPEVNRDMPLPSARVLPGVSSVYMESLGSNRIQEVKRYTELLKQPISDQTGYRSVRDPVCFDKTSYVCPLTITRLAQHLSTVPNPKRT